METSPSNPVADASLVEAARLGDDRAFAILYRRYHDDIRALCLRTLRDPHTAEDLAQETFLRALRNIGDFEPGRPVWPWLATIARNLCVDEVRGITRRAALGRTASRDADRGVDVTSEEALDRVERQRLRRVVTGALAGLRARDRRVFVLQNIMGWSHEEIARNHQISVHAVRNLAWRARRALRRSLSSERTWGLIVAFRFRWTRRRAPSGTRAARFDVHGLVAERVAAIILGITAVAGAAAFGGDSAPARSQPADVADRWIAEPRTRLEAHEDRLIVSVATAVRTHPRSQRPRVVAASIGIAPARDHAAAPSGTAASIAVQAPDGTTLLVHDHDVRCGGQGGSILPRNGPIAFVC